ncbi:CUB and sushi domain-containing protein 3-like [Hyla sarda]|uniref:CUB and sushi domain-containing protein 3-like n=1 Tax=Hyla sarda TaxID=327740 RepID=UPI0024C3A722|nr:CUB and sushi domain-containing protein 3-like [Hyla sarda]
MLPLPCIVRRIWTVFLIFQFQIFCISGDCGPPPVIEHTLPVKETSGAAGDTVIYECDHDSGYYELPGKSRTTTCQDDNTWTSVSELCARACGDPERLAYAVPKDSDLKDIYLPGTKVSFDCRLGFSRVPRSNNSIVCLDSYTWSVPSEFCTRRSCVNPGEIANGEFEATNNFLFGSRLTYTCNPGYRILSRRNYRDCQADGTWTNTVPTCEAVICPAPDPPVNGMFSPEKDEYAYQDAVNFICNKNLHIIGEDFASCTSDGTWSTTTPTCKAISCEDPGPVQNGKKASGFVGPYTWKSSVSYQCDPTFVMNGSSSVTCTVDSRWDPDIPECLSVCDPPPNNYDYAVLKEQHIAGRNYFDKTTVEYKCRTGYEIDPNKNNIITCMGRSWSALATFCSPVSCGDPGNVANAEKLAPKFTFGSRVEYKCHERYKITSPSNYKECQADRNWSPGEIICTVTCKFPSVASLNLKPVSKSVYVHNDVVTLECIEGFVLNGSRSVACNSEGLWEPSLPKCKELPQKDNHIGVIVGSIIGCLAILVIVCCLCWCCKKKKSGIVSSLSSEYYCEYKNDKFIVNPEGHESNNINRKPKSDTPDVQYVACNDA